MSPSAVRTDTKSEGLSSFLYGSHFFNWCVTMKTRLSILGIVLLCISYRCSVDAQVPQNPCVLQPPSDLIQKPFPDIFNMSVLSYQLAVELTFMNEGQTNFYTEYYDILDRKGRVDVQREGKGTETYFYFHETRDAFSLQDYSCKRENISSIPEFLNVQYDWLDVEGNREVYGPSAMFRKAFLKQKKDRSSVVFMGDYISSSSTVRGLKSQYWRSCLEENVVAEYYFTDPGHKDAYGFKNLAVVPLRIVVAGVDPSMKKEYLPQNYEFISFQPYVSEGLSVFELPVGAGCERLDSDDFPDLPSFSTNSLQFYAEAIYRFREDEVHSYYSNFMLTWDLPSNHLAYFYTPWGKFDNTAKEQMTEFPLFIVHDATNQIVYERNFSDGSCSIGRTPKFSPQYELPNQGGHIDLNDPTMLFTNNELYYLADGQTRGLDVHMFGAVIKNYTLGTRVIPEAEITHYYLLDNEIEMTNVAVQNALVRIRLSFSEADRSKWLGTLNINFFGFSTKVEKKNVAFDISSCFPNNDDSMFVTIGFPADASVIEKIRTQVPSIEESFLNYLTLEAGLPPVRIPKILVDFSDGLYITMLLLQRPPIMLDFDEEIPGTTIEGSLESIAETSRDGCGLKCLESEEDCWGFAFCKATCFLGSGTEAKLKPDSECTVRRRLKNDSFIPTMEQVAFNVKRLLDDNRLKIEIPIDSEEEPIRLVGNYFETSSSGEVDDMLNNMGRDLNPRMRVQKYGSKLDSSAGSVVKNLGSLSFDQCQRMCLDYRRCETVSYCLNTRECIASLTYGENIPEAQIKKDYYCAIVTRKFGDQFERIPGNVLSKESTKTIKSASDEDCARSCALEKSFKCLSFDHCPPPNDPEGCRLHNVHYLDVKQQEASVTAKSTCGHYSRKYSYEFKKEDDKRTMGSGISVATDINQEECAKRCVENVGGTCHGFDFCQDKDVTTTSCVLMNLPPSKSKTIYSSICTHFTRDMPDATSRYSNSLAGGLGFLFFIIGGVVGVGIVFLIAYFRVNKPT